MSQSVFFPFPQQSQAKVPNEQRFSTAGTSPVTGTRKDGSGTKMFDCKIFFANKTRIVYSFKDYLWGQIFFISCVFRQAFGCLHSRKLPQFFLVGPNILKNMSMGPKGLRHFVEICHGGGMIAIYFCRTYKTFQITFSEI